MQSPRAPPGAHRALNSAVPYRSCGLTEINFQFTLTSSPTVSAADRRCAASRMRPTGMMSRPEDQQIHTSTLALLHTRTPAILIANLINSTLTVVVLQSAVGRRLL